MSAEIRACPRGDDVYPRRSSRSGSNSSTREELFSSSEGIEIMLQDCALGARRLVFLSAEPPKSLTTEDTRVHEGRQLLLPRYHDDAVAPRKHLLASLGAGRMRPPLH